jgi:hypothetical protein
MNKISDMTDVAPDDSTWQNKLYEITSGIGYGLGNQIENLGQMVIHPLDTLHSIAVGAGQAMDNPYAAAQSAWQSIRQKANQAASSPFNLGYVVGENVNPRKLSEMLIPNVRELEAYHGTPHKFEQFDASKIGTGEGAQAYGHGLYFAESPDVAEGYRVALSYDPDKMRIGGKQINDVYDAINNNAARMPVKQAAGEYEKLELLEKLMMNDSVDAVSKHAAEMSPSTAAWFEKQVKPNFQTYGSLYHVDIPDEMIDRMLDWDKPLSEQPNSVLKAIQQINSEFSVPYAKMDEPLGFYVGKLGDAVGGHANASKLMATYGIPGIRYLDAGSRGAGGSGTRNIVVFPGEEKNIKILSRK